MPHAKAQDGTRLFYESEGKGPPIVFVHELAGTRRSFAPQIAAFQHRWHCLAFNARGYPPSDVPQSLESYSQEIAAADIGAVLDAAGAHSAHVMGVSMGSAAALQFALREPHRVRSLVLCSIGSGSDAPPGSYGEEMEARARALEAGGMAEAARNFANSPSRKLLKEKNPALYQAFLDEVGRISVTGIANTMRGVQKRRPLLYAHEAAIAALRVPTLVVVGGEDEACLKPSRFLAERLPGARLEVIPHTGHGLNLEEPVRVNELVEEFLTEAEAP